MALLVGPLVGAAIVFWGFTHQNHHTAARETQIVASFAPTPIVSVEQAAPQLPFRIHVPGVLPVSTTLLGVRVTQVHAVPDPGLAARVRSRQFPRVGYGILIMTESKQTDVVIRASQRGPAERAGLSAHRFVRLISVNGRPAANNRSAVSLLRGNPPLTIEVEDSDDVRSTITLPRKETYMAGAEMPDPLPSDKRAALLYALGGRQFAILERIAPHVPRHPIILHDIQGRPMVFRDQDGAPPMSGGRSIAVGGVSVHLTGPADRPNAEWVAGGVDYLVNNYQQALTEADIEHIVQTMSPM